MDNQTINTELIKIKVDVWKTVIDTQKHFNDLEMKVRNFGILILSAFIGAIGVTINSGYFINAFGINISISAILSLGAAVIWWLFYFVDVYWYHPLLLGSVKQGLAIENDLESVLPIIGLTKEIGKNSPKDFLFCKEIHSTTKAKIFYFGILFILCMTSITLFFIPPAKNISADITIHCERNSSYVGFDCKIKK